jgi:hypothetical protein
LAVNSGASEGHFEVRCSLRLAVQSPAFRLPVLVLNRKRKRKLEI